MLPWIHPSCLPRTICSCRINLMCFNLKKDNELSVICWTWIVVETIQTIHNNKKENTKRSFDGPLTKNREYKKKILKVRFRAIKIYFFDSFNELDCIFIHFWWKHWVIYRFVVVVEESKHWRCKMYECIQRGKKYCTWHQCGVCGDGWRVTFTFTLSLSLSSFIKKEHINAFFIVYCILS